MGSTEITGSGKLSYNSSHSENFLHNKFFALGKVKFLIFDRFLNLSNILDKNLLVISNIQYFVSSFNKKLRDAHLLMRLRPIFSEIISYVSRINQTFEFLTI